MLSLLRPQPDIGRLASAHYEVLYRYAYRLAGSAAEAADLTQETFFIAQTQLKQLRDPDRARPWLIRILRNLFLQSRRRMQHIHFTDADDLADELVEPMADEPPEITEEALQAALSSLDERFRLPLVLFYFEDLSYQAIADTLEIPIGTVMSRLARAKGHLRRQLAAAARPASPLRIVPRPGAGSA